MLSWLDLLLLALFLWQGLAGYLFGTKKAGLRLVVMVGAVGLALPFAANCASYLAPVVEPVFNKSIQAKAILVSSGQLPSFLGPWHEVLSLSASTGLSDYIQRLVGLALNVTGLAFLVLVLISVYYLIEQRKLSSQEHTIGGMLIGTLNGLFTAVILLTLLPVLSLSIQGDALNTALEGSLLVDILKPLVRLLVIVFAPYLI